MNRKEPQFHFEQWVTKYDLENIKDLLVKHGAITPNTLLFDSSEFKSMLSDPAILTKTETMSKLMNAINLIHLSESTSIIKIFISKEEENVLNLIKNNLNILNNKQNQLNNLQKEHTQIVAKRKKDKLEQITKTERKIKKIFNELRILLHKRKQNILNQLNKIRNRINNQKNNNEVDDIKQDALCEICTEAIEKTRNFLKKKQDICNKLTSTNDNRSQRKINIINIGKDVNNKFIKTQNIINDNVDTINMDIEKHNKMVIEIDYVFDNNQYKKLLKNVNTFGKIINKSSFNDADNDDDNKDEKGLPLDDDINDKLVVIQLKKEFIQQRKKYTILQNKLNQQNKIITDLKLKNNEYKELEIKLNAYGNMNWKLYNNNKTIKDLKHKLKTKTNLYKQLENKFNEHEKTLKHVINSKLIVEKTLKNVTNNNHKLHKNIQNKNKTMKLLTSKISNFEENEKKAFKLLSNSLSFSNNDFRWYKLNNKSNDNDDLKNDNNDLYECVKINYRSCFTNNDGIQLLNGEIKKVSKDLLLIKPYIDKINFSEIATYIKYLIKNSKILLSGIYTPWHQKTSNDKIQIDKYLIKRKSTFNGYAAAFSVNCVSSGSITWKLKILHGSFIHIGIIKDPTVPNASLAVHCVADSFLYHGVDGKIYKQKNGFYECESELYGSSYGVGDVITVLVNADQGKLLFDKNGTSQGGYYKIQSKTKYYLAVCLYYVDDCVQFID